MITPSTSTPPIPPTQQARQRLFIGQGGAPPVQDGPSRRIPHQQPADAQGQQTHPCTLAGQYCLVSAVSRVPFCSQGLATARTNIANDLEQQVVPQPCLSIRARLERSLNHYLQPIQKRFLNFIGLNSQVPATTTLRQSLSSILPTPTIANFTSGS